MTVPHRGAGLPERDDLGDPVGAGRLAEQDEPSSIASPPNTVTSSAWTAALRFSRASPLWPTSRNDVTDVSSQNR